MPASSDRALPNLGGLDAFAAALAETTQSLVCVLDADGRILVFNDACERATGFTRQEVVGADAREWVIPPEEAAAFDEVLAHVWATARSRPRSVTADAEVAEQRLQDAAIELDAALRELRELARGLHPAVLTEHGLGRALDVLVECAPFPGLRDRAEALGGSLTVDSPPGGGTAVRAQLPLAED
jgi:PAS domain S-box-containing protein